MSQVNIIRNILIFLASSCFYAKGQSLYTFNSCSNALYRGGSSNIIYVDDCENPDSLFILADHGAIKSIEMPNKPAFIWSTDDTTQNTTQIFLYKIIGKDTVLSGTFLFKIYDIPEPILYLSSKSGGKIAKEEIISCPVVQVSFDRSNCIFKDIDILFKVVDFSYLIISKEGINHYTITSSNRFNEFDIENFKKLEHGDILLFYNIFIISGYLNKPMKIAPSEFVIE